VQTRISLARVSKFLQEDELQTDAVVRDFFKSSEFAIQFEEATFNWEPTETTKPTLKNLNLKVKHGERVAICGEVGAGKSSLIQAILGEIPKVSGVVS
jgi:ABC-type transport system involved in cytochrome bd biosynthesis fused ATPase/permease subunit